MKQNHDIKTTPHSVSSTFFCKMMDDLWSFDQISPLCSKLNIYCAKIYSTYQVITPIHLKSKCLFVAIIVQNFFISHSQIHVHSRTDTGEKPFSCIHCLKGFSVGVTLKKHLRTHLGEKPFPCNQCPKSFSEGGDLKKHLRIHSGEKPFPCNQCPKTFSMASGLKTHLRMNSGIKPFPYNQCPKRFSLSYNLKTHLRSYSGEIPFPCNQCPKSF